MGYVMFRVENKMRLIGRLLGIRDSLVDYNDTFWEIDARTPIYVDNFDDDWAKAKVPKDVYEYGAYYIRITENNEIECEFSEEESTELENGEGLAWIISD